jgi:dye decolorizing peroxidase
LQRRWGQADLLLQITCDDPLTLAHADRVLQREGAPFATVAWVQEGFRYARGSRPDGTTMRNLFGQVDGTTNPRPGTPDFDSVVWRSGTDAFGAGSTTLVLRRIAMNLDAWDEVDRSAREDAVGRRLRDGAPITGGGEHSEPDFEAKQGLVTKVADFAHVRRARTGRPSQRIYRRAYNYADPGARGSDPDRAGLLFAAFQADPVQQFHPIQQRLAELDMMNEWTHPVGSAVFWIPPSARTGGFIGEGLF